MSAVFTLLSEYLAREIAAALSEDGKLKRDFWIDTDITATGTVITFAGSCDILDKEVNFKARVTVETNE